MYAFKCLYRFQLHINTILNYEVSYEVTNTFSFLFKFDHPLPFVIDALQVELNAKCIFVHAFKQSSSQHSMYFYCCTDNLIRDRFAVRNSFILC